MPQLAPSAYVILGLLDRYGPSTPYGLDRTVAAGIGFFWAFPRSQLYAEAGRLARLGLVREQREETGRRRRLLTVTATGRAALASWAATPTAEPTQIRDEGLLRLFLTAPSPTARQDLERLAGEQEQAHRDRLALYDELVASGRMAADSPQLATLELGRRFEQAAVEFWAAVPSRVRPGPPPLRP